MQLAASGRFLWLPRLNFLQHLSHPSGDIASPGCRLGSTLQQNIIREGCSRCWKASKVWYAAQMMFSFEVKTRRRIMNDCILSRLEKAGAALNNKCEFNKSEINFWGHRLNKDGVRPIPERTKAVANMPQLQNVTEVKGFLGMANQLGKFTSQLAEVLMPLRQLLSKDAEWTWDTPQQEAFQRIKDILCSSEILALYDKDKPTVVTADASSHGLGAPLLQRQKKHTSASVLCIQISSSRRAQLRSDREGGISIYMGLWEVFRVSCGAEGLHTWDWSQTSGTLVGHQQSPLWPTSTSAEIPDEVDAIQLPNSACSREKHRDCWHSITCTCQRYLKLKTVPRGYQCLHQQCHNLHASFSWKDTGTQGSSGTWWTVSGYHTLLQERVAW